MVRSERREFAVPARCDRFGRGNICVLSAGIFSVSEDCRADRFLHSGSAWLDAEFARFLDIARGSLNECRNHIGDARDRRYIDEKERAVLDLLAGRAVGAVAGLQRSLRGRREQKGD